MPAKELNTTYKGIKIRVKNTWFSGAKLYIDGDCKDVASDLLRLDGDTPLMSASIDTPDGKEIVEVFMEAIFTTKMKIHANGEMIAGENF